MRGCTGVLATLLAGCGDDGGSLSRLDSGLVDTQLLDSALSCYGTGLTAVCLMNAPASRNFVDVSINTNSDPQCLATYTQFCAIGAGAITVGGVVRATGTRPLVLVAQTTLTIEGTLDASSTNAGIVGAGSRSTCNSITGSSSASGGAGGGGGTFGGRGGNGGDGANGLTIGGTASFPTSQTTLRGGCSGGGGGTASVALGGPGGRGGGAILLIAGTRIDVPGNIYAAGAGGIGGAATLAGGGGGGSGGMIALDAPTITVTGTMIANGGGGGGGAANTAGGNGDNGSASAGRAMGGAAGTGGATAASPGALGAGGTISTGDTALDAAAGGGGGGGGAGIIRLFPMQTIAGTVSPPPT